ncbi:MAG: PAS domain S-box protein [Rhodospirillales bacterium]|nr:PAS domain S-box protein [Rhodospirillales bacterium]
MRLKLSHKITSLVAFAALLAGLAVGLADYSQASRELREAAEAKLGALLEARKAAIEDYLDSIRRDLRSQAENPFLVESFQAFLVGWEELGPGAAATMRNLYHTANPHPSGERRLLDHAGDPSIYSLGHHRFHPRLRAFTARYGYRDLLLVDRDGNVVYSVMKKADFATNLVHGPYGDTGLGRVFEAATAAAAGEAFSDFERYGPSEGRATGFVGAALRNELDEIIGAVVLEMPVDRINQVMQVSAGLGRTGEALLIGPDFLTRSDWQSDAGSTILSRRVETDPVRAALDGRSGLMASREDHPPQGSHDILAAYAPLDFLGTRWAIVVTADLAEVYGPVERMRERAVVNGLLLACLVALLGVAVTRWVVVAPLSAVTAAVGRLASGDRRAKLPLVPRGDEIGDIARALVMFRDSLDERDRLVAEREQERHRREVRRRLAEAIESIPDGFALLDQNDRIVLVNQRMRQIYPRSAHLLEPGRPYEEFLRNQAELGEIAEAVGHVEEFVTERMARLRNPRAPFEHRMTSGQWLRVADYRTEDGGALCIRSDITELKDREEALRASEERFRRLSEITFEGLLILDDGVIVDCNRAMLEMGGYEPADLIGKSSLTLLAPEYRDFARERVAAMDERAYEAVALRKDGSRAPVDLNFRHVTYGDRTLRVVTVRDITERKRAEQALRESEERFRAIAEAVPIPIVIIEVAENKLVFANAHAATMFGLPVDAAVRIRPDDYYADPQVSRPRLAREMESKGWIENLEVEMRRHDGSRFWALLSARPMTHLGQPALLVGIIDISALKRTEVALRESEWQVRAIVETAADPIVMVDDNRRILEFNPAAEKAFGYARDQILGQPMERILPPHLHDHNRKLFDAHLTGGLPSDLDRRIELEG